MVPRGLKQFFKLFFEIGLVLEELIRTPEVLFIKSAYDVIIFKFSNSEKGPWISQLYAGYTRASITHVEFKDINISQG